MKLPNKKYNIIYADPPWKYPKSGGIKSARGLAKKYYCEMELEDIKKLRVQDIANENCYLFLWATAPNILEAIEVLNTWGFNFFTIAFVWIKKNKKSDGLFWGMGNSTRANAEFVLLGRKGKLKRYSAKIHQIIMSRIREHSRKPDEVRNKIVELYGDLPRIELFARQRFEGWDVWGNEVSNAVQTTLTINEKDKVKEDP